MIIYHKFFKYYYYKIIKMELEYKNMIWITFVGKS